MIRSQVSGEQRPPYPPRTGFPAPNGGGGVTRRNPAALTLVVPAEQVYPVALAELSSFRGRSPSSFRPTQSGAQAEMSLKGAKTST